MAENLNRHWFDGDGALSAVRLEGARGAAYGAAPVVETIDYIHYEDVRAFEDYTGSTRSGARGQRSGMGATFSVARSERDA